MSRSVYVLVLLFGFVSIGYAADADKSKAAKDPLLPPVDLNGYLQGYSVELNTDDARLPDATIPQGLSTLEEDRFQPFLGLKLTKPLETK